MTGTHLTGSLPPTLTKWKRGRRVGRETVLENSTGPSSSTGCLRIDRTAGMSTGHRSIRCVHPASGENRVRFFLSFKIIYRYDVVARMETFSADSEYIINRYIVKSYATHNIVIFRAGLSDRLKVHWKNQRSKLNKILSLN